MKAVRFHGIHDVRCEDVAKPDIQDKNDVIIRVLYAGICGSDLHIYNKGMFVQNIPEIMGHEFVGQVKATGDNVSLVSPGDIVAANPMVPCMECISCRIGNFNTCSSLGFIGEVRPGCFAEYISMPENTLIKCPSIPDTALLALAEPLAVALNICEKMQLSPDDTLGIIGTGPIGLLTILAAKNLYGVKSITAVNRSFPRLALAEKLGASETFSTLPDDKYFSKTVEAAGREASYNTAAAHTLPGGTLGIVSIFEDIFNVDLNTIVASQIKIQGCNAYEKRHIEEAVSAISEKKIDVSPLITEIFNLNECKEAFSLFSSNEKKAVKILFKI
jgi:threonine dehydrogenase-like Zn-dependent dehydrogenase